MLFFFFLMDKLGCIFFYFFFTPGISVGSILCLSLPPVFLSSLFPIGDHSALPSLPPSYILVCNLFAVRLSLWFTGPLLCWIIINGLLCWAPASSTPFAQPGSSPLQTENAYTLHRGTCSHTQYQPSLSFSSQNIMKNLKSSIWKPIKLQEHRKRCPQDGPPPHSAVLGADGLSGPRDCPDCRLN